MDALVGNFSMIVVVGLIVVLVISQLHRRLGSILGIALWIAVAGLGTLVYERGGAIGLGPLRFDRMMFYALCAALVGMNTLGLRSAARRAPPPAED